MSYTVAITGKGGVGKTTVASLLVTRLVARGCAPVLAIDADPNSCLDSALGLELEARIFRAQKRPGEAARVLDYLRDDAARAYDHYEAMISQEGQQGLARELARMGYEIIELNIGNPGLYGFRTPETMRLAMIEIRKGDTATLGISMVQEINNDWMLPLETVLPANRLGPIYADVPKVACATCHKGYQRPIQGLNVIGDYPELAAAGAPGRKTVTAASVRSTSKAIWL